MPEWLKTIIAIPFYSLLMVPPYYIGSRVLKLRKISFGAIFVLVLIVGALLQIIAFAVSPIQDLMPSVIGTVFSVVVYALIAAAALGYLVTTEEKTSIGFVKGLLLSLIMGVTGALMIPVISFLIVGVKSVLS